MAQSAGRGMSNLVQRALTLVGAGIAAVVVFLLATVGVVVALVAVVVLAVVVFIASRRSGGMGRFVIITNQPSASSSAPNKEHPAVEPPPATLYDLSPGDYTSNDKPPVDSPKS